MFCRVVNNTLRVTGRDPRRTYAVEELFDDSKRVLRCSAGWGKMTPLDGVRHGFLFLMEPCSCLGDQYSDSIEVELTEEGIRKCLTGSRILMTQSGHRFYSARVEQESSKVIVTRLTLQDGRFMQLPGTELASIKEMRLRVDRVWCCTGQEGLGLPSHYFVPAPAPDPVAEQTPVYACKCLADDEDHLLFTMKLSRDGIFRALQDGSQLLDANTTNALLVRHGKNVVGVRMLDDELTVLGLGMDVRGDLYVLSQGSNVEVRVLKNNH